MRGPSRRRPRWAANCRSVGLEPKADPLVRERVRRVDHNRPLEHRRNAERINRAHGKDRVALDAYGVPRRTTGKWVGDGDLPFAIEMDEVLSSELLPGLIWIKPESSRICADRVRRRRLPVPEAAKHPNVEFTLGWAESLATT